MTMTVYQIVGAKWIKTLHFTNLQEKKTVKKTEIYVDKDEGVSRWPIVYTIHIVKHPQAINSMFMYSQQDSKPPSPVPSQSSLQQYITNGSMYGGSSEGYRNNGYDSDSPRSMSISSSGSLSGETCNSFYFGIFSGDCSKHFTEDIEEKLSNALRTGWWFGNFKFQLNNKFTV